MTERQIANKIISDNSNIIPRKNHHKSLFKGVKDLVCIHCDKRFSFDTTERVYLFNAHGWVICDEDMKIFRTN